MKSNATIVYSFALVIVDFLALVAAFLGGYLIRGPLATTPVAHPIPATTYVTIFVTLLPFWIIVFALLGLYNSGIFENRWREIGRVLVGAFIGLMFVTFWAFIENRPIFPSKLVPVYGFAIGFILVLILRNFVRMIRGLLFRYKVGLTKILVVGRADTTQDMIKSLADSRRSGYRVIAVVGAKSAIGELKIPAFKTFKEYLGAGVEKPDEIIQTELYSYESKNREVLNYAHENHIGYRFVPGNTELFVGNLDVELFRNSIPVIAVHRTPLFGWGRVVKRGFDIIISALALIILSPILLLASLLIVVLDYGPVLFRQERITRFNGRFRVYKFRTMKSKYSGRSPIEVFRELNRPDLVEAFKKENKIDNDPRISLPGKFLRRFSLDELPQLVNVLMGDISLVGPRAIIAEELKFYDGKDSLLLSVKTGITGLAQVSGRSDLDYYERAKIDLYYVQNWSFWRDVTIIIKTVRVIFERRGAR